MIARIYAKEPGKRFRPLDLERGRFVVNLIHASTFWNEADIQRARSELLPKLAEENPGFLFELRTS